MAQCEAVKRMLLALVGDLHQTGPMPTLRELARSVRHAPGLEQMDFLWNALRPAYYRLTARDGRVAMRLGGQRVEFPLTHAQSAWEEYEREAMRAFVDWVIAYPDGTVIDVGASVGLYVHVALSVAPQAAVYAVDSDIASLRATRELAGLDCRLLQALISDRTGGATLLDALLVTERAVHSAAGQPHYRCLGEANAETIPQHSLDELFAAEPGPILHKIDIEGAEYLALNGALRLLARDDVTLLLSVHPELLPRYGGTRAQLEELLAASGHAHRVLAIDHEEHWLCRRY